MTKDECDRNFLSMLTWVSKPEHKLALANGYINGLRESGLSLSTESLKVLHELQLEVERKNDRP